MPVFALSLLTVTQYSTQIFSSSFSCYKTIYTTTIGVGDGGRGGGHVDPNAAVVSRRGMC